MELGSEWVELGLRLEQSWVGGRVKLWMRMGGSEVGAGMKLGRKWITLGLTMG